MFALVEIVEGRLFALDGAPDVFHDCFNKWRDVSYLYSFFEDRPEALEYYNVDKKNAVRSIITESREFFEDIIALAKAKDGSGSLDHLVFVPLHKLHDFTLKIVESKAYGTSNGSSYLRMYSVRLNDGSYIVVGGLIKTTQALQDCEEGREILKTLKNLVQFLDKNGYQDAYDVGILIV